MGPAAQSAETRTLLKLYRLLKLPKKYHGYSNTRSVVRCSYNNTFAPEGIAKQRAHLSYIQRNGSGINDGTPERIGNTDAKSIAEAGRDSGLQFRLILSPDPRLSISSIELYASETMRRFMGTLDEPMQWFGTAHYNTKTPHAHIVVDSGGTLRIGKETLKRLRNISGDVARELHGQRPRARQVSIDTEKQAQYGMAAAGAMMEAHPGSRKKAPVSIDTRER